VADELTLLCDRHHKEKTNHLLPPEDVERANASPFNVQRGISTPYGVHFSGETCEVRTSESRFFGNRTKLVPLLINNEEVIAFRFDGEQLFLSCQVRGTEGGVVLLIDDNELIYSTEVWDIDFVGNTLTARNGLKDFLFEIIFLPPFTAHITRLTLSYDDVLVLIDPKGVHVEGPGIRKRHIQRFYMSGFQYGLALDSDPSITAAIRI
jgi:trigger factor